MVLVNQSLVLSFPRIALAGTLRKLVNQDGSGESRDIGHAVDGLTRESRDIGHAVDGLTRSWFCL